MTKERIVINLKTIRDEECARCKRSFNCRGKSKDVECPYFVEKNKGKDKTEQKS